MSARNTSVRFAACALAALSLAAASDPAPAAPRPRVLVTGFEVKGDLLGRDSRLAESLEAEWNRHVAELTRE